MILGTVAAQDTTPVESGGGGGLVYVADFINGIYTADGETVTAADVVGNPEFIDAQGLNIGDANGFATVPIINDFLAVLLTGNWTVICEADLIVTSDAAMFSIQDDGGGDTYLFYAAYNVDNETEIYEAINMEAGRFATDAEERPAGLTRIAIARTNSRLVASVNGGAVFGTESDRVLTDPVAASFGGYPDQSAWDEIRIRYFEVRDQPESNAALSELSEVDTSNLWIGTATGIGAAAAVGADNGFAAAQGTAAGVGAAAAEGADAGFAAAQGTAAGIGTAAAVGSGLTTAQGTAAGAGAAAAEGADGSLTAPLDGLTPTGAWSFARKLFTAYAGDFWENDGSGNAATLYDQSGNGRDFVDTSTSPAVTTFGPNSRACGDFDSANDFMATSATLATFVDNNAAYMIISCVWDTLTSNSGASYSNHGAFGDQGGFLGIYGKSGGVVHAFNWDGSDDHADGSITAGVGAVVELRHEGGNLYIRVNNGTESSATTSGNTTTLTGVLRLGRAGNTSGQFLDGKVIECAIFDVVPDSSTRSAIAADFKAYAGF